MKVFAIIPKSEIPNQKLFKTVVQYQLTIHKKDLSLCENRSNLQQQEISVYQYVLL